MNKSELVEALAHLSDTSKATAARVLDNLADVVGDHLLAGGDITLPGLGKFKVSERAARTGRNPQTGETIQIAASKNVSFKATKALKEKVNQ